MPKTQKKYSKKPSKKIKSVLFIVDAWFPFVGGGQIYAQQLKKQLESKYGLKVWLEYPPHHHIVIRLLWSIFIPWKLAFSYMMIAPDLIHSQGYNSGFVGWILAKVFNCSVVHTVHGSNLMDLKTKGFKAKLERWLLTGLDYDHQISVTRSFLEYENKNKVTYIPNGVDLEAFDTVAQKKTQGKRILWIGRKDPVKGHDLFLECLDRLRSQDSTIEADIILGGGLTQYQLIKHYKKADLLVISSRSEGLPLVLLEAWAAKIPVVAFMVGEIPDLIKKSKAGLLVTPEDSSELATKILSIIDKPKKLKKMGLAGYNFVKRRYTWEEVAKKTYKIYEKAIKKHA